jgi:N-hydroxyarylamine O-acetyltransferase
MLSPLKAPAQPGSDVMQQFDRDRYCQRIGHQNELRTTEDGLRSLHCQQLCAIPFENFDVLLGRPIELDPDSLFAKLVCRPRGGYCFELNGLFLHVLRSFGFAARPLLARVHLSGSSVIGRGHQISLVTIDGREWLTDVGFGGFNMREPIPLEIDRLNHCSGQDLRLVRADPYGTMLQVLTSEQKWLNLYSFDMEYVGPGDIKYGNYYTSTHPDCHFTQNRMASLATREGRVSLHNLTLRTVQGGSERITEMPDDSRYLDGLKAHFGIELDAPYDMLPALPTAACR